jgi:hypothetical protein
LINFLKKKCKEYIEKYLAFLLDLDFFNDRINDDFCYNKGYYKWVNDVQYLHIEIAPQLLRIIWDEKELLENEDMDFIIFISMISTCESWLIFEGTYQSEYYDYILDIIQIDNYIYEMYDDEDFYITKFKFDPRNDIF